MNEFNSKTSLSSAANEVFEIFLAPSSSQAHSADFSEMIYDYLVQVQEWMPMLVHPMPHKSYEIEKAMYACFLRCMSAQVLEMVGKSDKMSITSPPHVRGMLDDYLKGIDAIARLNWRLSGTADHAISTKGQQKRSAAARALQQELLVGFLRSILPGEHFAALEKLGIDAEDWHLTYNAGLAYGLKEHGKFVAKNREEIAQTFRIGKREQSAGANNFVRELANIYQLGFRDRPIAWHNRVNGENSLFYDFVGAAWKVGLGENCPSADTVAAMLNSKTAPQI